jgi:hypothetical protein
MHNPGADNKDHPDEQDIDTFNHEFDSFNDKPTEQQRGRSALMVKSAKLDRGVLESARCCRLRMPRFFGRDWCNGRIGLLAEFL